MIADTFAASAPAGDAEALYQAVVLERARAPHHGSLLACFDAEATGNNPMCGDRVRLRVRHGGDGRIEDVGFDARGCAICLASADLMADGIRGRADVDARALSRRFVDMVRTGTVPHDPAFGPLRALAGVHEFRSRIRCATLAWSALDDALAADRHGETGGRTIDG